MNYPEQAPRWRRYLRMIRPNVLADVDDELRFHFESRIEELVASGKTPRDAREIAVAEFGDVQEVQRGLVSIDRRVAARRGRVESLRDLGSDVRYAIRSLGHSKSVALAILATLGLGVGANAAMFTLLETIYVRPPAGVAAPSEIRRVWRTVRFREGSQYWPGYSYVQFSAVTNALGDRATTATYAPPGKAKLGTGESTAQVQLSDASTGYFSLLGVRAALGRLYSADEDRLDNPAPVAVLSYSYWERAYGGKASALGSTIVVAAQKYTVVGVAQKGFTGIDLDAADIWVPLGSRARGRRGALSWWKSNSVNGFGILVRPAPGVDIRELEQRTTTALRRPEAAYGSSDSTTVARFGSIIAANGPGESSQEQRIAIRLAGVAMIVLLIACANVVNLLLARAVRRRREIAVRLALGISRSRLLRLLLVESALLSLAAATVALAIAYGGGVVLRKLLLPDVHWARSPIDGNVVLVCLGVAAASGLVAGLIPALQAAGPELTDALKTGSGGGVVRTSRLRITMVIAQAALSVVLLVGATLFVRSLANVRQVDIGFDAHRILTTSVGYDGPSASRDSTIPQRIAVLAQEIRALPGVDAAALASMEPMAGLSFVDFVVDEASTAPAHWDPVVTGISPNYFAATGLHIVRGRGLAPVNGRAPAEVVVNETMAKGQWPNSEAIGRCMRFSDPTAPCYRVVGVVEDSRVGQVLEAPQPQYYLPLGNIPDSAASFLRGYYVVARIDSQHVADITSATRALVHRDFPGGVPDISQLSQHIEPQYRPWKLGASLFTVFGVLALVVALIGIYSTVSYGVNQRLHEFGIRIALGAQLRDVLSLVIGEGMRTLAVGAFCGVLLSLAAGRFVASLLFGISPGDPITIAAVVATLLAVGAFAAFVPARRAARVDPVSALRAD
ncbi:MAG TPA: ADOP family duplicated permease [Gemmatimonadaceae bacterium]|jgi:predicted permease